VSGRAPRFKGTASSPFELESETLGLRFKVMPGEVTYVGSVVFSFPDWQSHSGPTGPMRVLTADTRSRDEAVVRLRYPNLKAALPERSVANAPDPSRKFKYYFHLLPLGDSKSM
jgi:hypothetical protein